MRNRSRSFCLTIMLYLGLAPTISRGSETGCGPAYGRVAWRPVSVESFLAGASEKNVVLSFFSHDIYGARQKALFGKVEATEIAPGYTVLKVSDAEGNLHFIDPELVRIQTSHASTEIHVPPRLEVELNTANRHASSHIDLEKVKPQFCADYYNRQKSPEYRELAKIVDRNYSLRKGLDFPRAAQCVFGIIGGALTQAVNVELRARTEQGNWIRDHSSNFFYSMGYMFALDQCLQSLSPQHRHAFLAATLGASVAGNTWEEIDLSPHIENHSLPIFNSKGEKVKTDLEDYKNGILGTLTYLVGIKLIETQLPGFRVAFFCR